MRRRKSLKQLRATAQKRDVTKLFEKLVETIQNTQAPASIAISSPFDVETLQETEKLGTRYVLVCHKHSLAPSAPMQKWSQREKQIIRLVAAGLPNKCIGYALNISTWTVSSHLRRLFAKAGVTRREALIAKLAQLCPEVLQSVYNEPAMTSTSRKDLRIVDYIPSLQITTRESPSN